MKCHDNGQVQIYCKDSRTMPELADESVQCVVTSPPYWGLRKYSGEQEMVWGGDHCEHEWGELVIAEPNAMGGQGYKQDTNAGSQHTNYGHRQRVSNLCPLCGAWRGGYGLEPTPEMYVEHTLEFLREIRRVLRKDGVVFWNIGDSYGSGKGTCFNPGGGKGSFSGHGDRKDAGAYPLDRGNISMLKASGLKPKDLCLIPFRVALAAQADGWWVRSIIIWSKPNPMPESVTDRPTESHEYILMLTKSAKYYWDADAVREPNSPTSNKWGATFGNKTTSEGGIGRVGDSSALENKTRQELDVYYTNGRNIRTVWEFPTQPYPEAHFAVFPEALPERCIMAATPPKCCAECGAPWERVVEQSRHYKSIGTNASVEGSLETGRRYQDWYQVESRTLGWRPTCSCNAGTKPPLVLDPFMGAGTTLWVAKKLGRRAVGYDLSEEYCSLAVERCRQMVMELGV